MWPSSCWTLSKVSCSDTTVGANSGVSLASWRKKTCEITFCTDDLQNTWKNTVKIEKKVCRLAPAMRNSNRNFDTRDKNAVNTRICLLSRWRKSGVFPGVANHAVALFFPTSLCGVLVFGCALPPASSSFHRLLRTQLVHTTCSHTTCSHTTCSHTTYTQLAHIQLTHTHTTCPRTTYTHTTYSHTTCSHTTCSHTTCSHTPCPHTTCPHTTYSHTHTQLTHTHTHTKLAHTQNLLTHNLLTHNFLTRRHRPSLCVAGVALMALGCLWWHAWFPVDAVVAAAVGVAGVTFGDTLRGTWRHGPALAWQAWHSAT